MKLYVAIPCMDYIPTEFFKNLLLLKTPPKTAYGITVASLTYDARNTLAKAVLDSDIDRVMWFDSDMTFQPDIIDRLSADIDEGRDFVTGLYFTRKNPIKPVLMSEVGAKDTDNGFKETYATFFNDYPKDQIFEVEASGFGVVMTTVKLLRDVSEHFGSPFMPIPGLGEDISFCQRAKELGYKLYCDSRIKAGHLATFPVTEEYFEKKVVL